jgi:hypothetical protein
MAKAQPEESDFSQYPLTPISGGSRSITMKDRLSTVNLTLGFIGTILGIFSSILVILSITRPDLLKRLLDRFFPGLEEQH